MEAFGNLNMELSLVVNAETPEEGLQKARERIPSEDIAYIRVELITTNGCVHKVKYADEHFLTWTGCLE
jgi:hypothetical protein